ncbi:unnamed protein product [Caenorhabditis auriculariae]|uniref:Uncharacterized protein n=1 Tax=Caenorhabditis auriculariae TaxID=2777116 RepID=A0A8S1GNQ6_9PELO|nr:unnamed protein product [Caenorhabditis auriculariae]
MGRFKPLPPGGERNGFKNPTITRNALSDAEFEKEVKTKLEQFKKSDSKEMILPPMDRTCRKKCHEIACMMGLLTRSSGEEPDRKIMLTKRIYGRIIHKGSVVDNNPIELTPKAKSAIETLIEQHPISEDDVDAHLFQSSKAPKERKTTVEFRGSMLIPPAIPDNPLHSFRRKLPSFAFREEIIQSVRKNTVVIITGGTGCGKTTQVPQFLLEDALSNHEKIRIFCTQPRRLPAIAISERVAKERDENIGKTVGYHIRLEQKTSPQTILTYCTSGVLLRMLSHDPTAKGISHIILDEVHERETNTDYLLIALKHALRKRNDLKVILMSATLEGNLALFKNYFDAPVRVVQIESKWFDVQRFYADDVLAMVGYVPPKGMFDTVLTVAGSDFPVMDSWTGAPEKAEWTASSSGKTHWEPPHMHQAQTMPNLGRGYVQDVENFYPPQHPSMSSNDLNHVEQHQNYMNMAHKLASSQSSTHLSYTQPVQPFAQMSVSHDHYPMQQCSFYQNHMPVEGPYRQGQQQIFEKWTAGPYVMDDGFVVSEDYMNHMQTQMGFYEHPMQAVPVQNWQNDGQQTQYVDYGSSSYSNGHYLASYPSANGRANEPMFYVPSTSDSASNQMSYPAPQKNETQPRGLSGFGASDFGESMRKQQELADRYRYDLKTLLPKKPSHFEPSVVSMIKNNRRLIDSANLYYKYRAVGAETWAQGVDPDLTFSLISYLVCSPIKGAILVFLPGYEDIQAQRDLLYSYKPDGTNGYEMIEVYLLHSQMNSTDQQKVFDRRPSNIRKIILSTNISEASLTIDDVVFVIDTGKVKEKVYDHNMKFSQLKTTSIAKSNAEQRAGRAGRCSEGYCFRLYSRKEYDAMPTTQIAEMQRSAIHDVCLHAKMFAPDRIRVADFLKSAPEPPSEQSIEQSLEFLEKIGALYSEAKTNDFFNDLPAKEEPQLTDLGRLIAHMPLEPQLARLLVFGVALKCLTPIVGLVAILSNRDPFIIPGPNERESANRSRDSFARRDFSDHLMLIRLLDEYIRVPMREQQRFCRDNFLNFSSLRMIFGIRRQLLLELYRAKLIDISDPNAALKDFNYNLYSECWPVVQAAIVAGCYPNIGIVKNQNKLKKIQTLAESNATLHPSSIVKRQVLNKGKRIDEENEPSLEFLAFHELAMIDEGLTVRNVTVVPSATVTLFSGAIRLKHSIIHDFGLIIGEFEAEMPPPKDPEDRYYDNSEYYEIEPWYSVKADRENETQG